MDGARPSEDNLGPWSLPSILPEARSVWLFAAVHTRLARWPMSFQGLSCLYLPSHSRNTGIIDAYDYIECVWFWDSNLLALITPARIPLFDDCLMMSAVINLCFCDIDHLHLHIFMWLACLGSCLFKSFAQSLN